MPIPKAFPLHIIQTHLYSPMCSATLPSWSRADSVSNRCARIWSKGGVTKRKVLTSHARDNPNDTTPEGCRSRPWQAR